jgi:putative flippase GtrA
MLEFLTRDNLAKDITFNGAFSNIFGYSCGILNSFFWNKVWTFKARYQTIKQFHNFIILNISCLVLSTIFLSIFVDILHAPHNIIWLLTMSVITFINYYGCKYWVFKNK